MKDAKRGRGAVVLEKTRRGGAIPSRRKPQYSRGAGRYTNLNGRTSGRGRSRDRVIIFFAYFFLLPCFMFRSQESAIFCVFGNVRAFSYAAIAALSLPSSASALPSST